MASVSGKCVKHSRTGQTLRCFRTKKKARSVARKLRKKNMAKTSRRGRRM